MKVYACVCVLIVWIDVFMGMAVVKGDFIVSGSLIQ